MTENSVDYPTNRKHAVYYSDEKKNQPARLSNFPSTLSKCLNEMDSTFNRLWLYSSFNGFANGENCSLLQLQSFLLTQTYSFMFFGSFFAIYLFKNILFNFLWIYNKTISTELHYISFVFIFFWKKLSQLFWKKNSLY